MSAPFPTDPSAAVFAPQQAIQIKERGTHIPTFYVRHENPAAIHVKRNGVTLVPSFTVAMVPPERRWAIGPDGNLLDQSDFAAKCALVYEETFRLQGEKVPGDPKREPVPDVLKYVSVQIDPTNPTRFVPMGYDPLKTAGARSETLWDAKGENQRDRMEVLREQYRSDPRRLLPVELEEVERDLGISTRRDPRLEKIDALSADLAAGRIDATSYARQVAAVMGQQIVVETTVARVSNVAKLTMACGKEIDKRGARIHAKNCRRCKELEPQPAA